VDYFEQLEHDPKDPNPWQALFFDRSIPFNPTAKAAFLYDSQSRSRQFLLPVARIICRGMIMLIQLLKILVPNVAFPGFLHKCLYWGMKYCISPEANYLILRHFNLGSEVLQFIKNNVEGVDIPMNPLKPSRLEDVKDNLFLIHDLNLFNFVIRLNKDMQQKGLEIKPVSQPNLSMITTGEFPFEKFRNGWTNILDLSTAIEMFTPIYQLLLTDKDFWRASNSLQLDETIGLYAATILNCPEKLVGLNNKHPMIPLNTLSAGFRLTLHGLSTEVLHALLVDMKKKRDKDLPSGISIKPSANTENQAVAPVNPDKIY
jgi:hypothetical protein